MWYMYIYIGAAGYTTSGDESLCAAEMSAPGNGASSADYVPFNGTSMLKLIFLMKHYG